MSLYLTTGRALNQLGVCISRKLRLLFVHFIYSLVSVHWQSRITPCSSQSKYCKHRYMCSAHTLLLIFAQLPAHKGETILNFLVSLQCITVHFHGTKLVYIRRYNGFHIITKVPSKSSKSHRQQYREMHVHVQTTLDLIFAQIMWQIASQVVSMFCILLLLCNLFQLSRKITLSVRIDLNNDWRTFTVVK